MNSMPRKKNCSVYKFKHTEKEPPYTETVPFLFIHRGTNRRIANGGGFRRCIDISLDNRVDCESHGREMNVGKSFRQGSPT